MDDKDITLRTVIDHMQSLSQQIRLMEERLMKRMDGIDRRINELEARINLVAANLTRQIDAIDKRLDEMEIAKLPQRVDRIEKHLQLSPVA